jgi:hypothetical protein
MLKYKETVEITCLLSKEGECWEEIWKRFKI